MTDLARAESELKNYQADFRNLLSHSMKNRGVKVQAVFDKFITGLNQQSLTLGTKD